MCTPNNGLPTAVGDDPLVRACSLGETKAAVRSNENILVYVRGQDHTVNCAAQNLGPAVYSPYGPACTPPSH